MGVLYLYREGKSMFGVEILLTKTEDGVCCDGSLVVVVIEPDDGVWVTLIITTVFGSEFSLRIPTDVDVIYSSAFFSRTTFQLERQP